SAITALILALGCFGASVRWLHAQDAQSRHSQDTALTIIVPDVVEQGDGPGVSVDLGGAPLLHRTAIEYPEAARQGGIQGAVAVQLTLDAAGNVADAHVVSGPMELRKAVMTSIFGLHFAQTVAGTTRMVSVSFQKAAADAAVRAEAKVVPGVLMET